MPCPAQPSLQAVDPPPIAARQWLGPPALLGRPATIIAHCMCCCAQAAAWRLMSEWGTRAVPPCISRPVCATLRHVALCCVHCAALCRTVAVCALRMWGVRTGRARVRCARCTASVRVRHVCCTLACSGDGAHRKVRGEGRPEGLPSCPHDPAVRAADVRDGAHTWAPGFSVRIPQLSLSPPACNDAKRYDVWGIGRSLCP